MSSEETLRKGQERGSEATIETAIEASQHQLNQVKTLAEDFLSSELETVPPEFYDEMNQMALQLGMLKALVTAEEGRRRSNPVRASARESSAAVGDALRHDIDSD